eukprot:scaffold8989_cov87-Phaeocystis_antarctica.AAC.4
MHATPSLATESNCSAMIPAALALRRTRVRRRSRGTMPARRHSAFALRAVTTRLWCRTYCAWTTLGVEVGVRVRVRVGVRVRVRARVSSSTWMMRAVLCISRRGRCTVRACAQRPQRAPSATCSSHCACLCTRADLRSISTRLARICSPRLLHTAAASVFSASSAARAARAASCLSRSTLVRWVCAASVIRGL